MYNRIRPAHGPAEIHFTVEQVQVDESNIQLGDQLLFEAIDVAPMEDGAVGITIRFVEVL